MNKGLTKIIVILTFMIIMVSYLSKTNEDKVYYKTISGDINELENLSLVYNYNKNLYYTPSMLLGYEQIESQGNFYSKNIESINSFMNYINMFSNPVSAIYQGNTNKVIIINKDGINTKTLTQQEIYDNYIENNNELYHNNQDEFNKFEDENYKGFAHIFYNEDNNYKYILVDIYNKKNNKNQEIKIPLGKEFNTNCGDDYIQFHYNFMYNGNVYSMILNNELENGEYKDIISILKLDLKNKSYKHIKDIKLENQEYLMGFSFINDNKVYLGIEKTNEYNGFYIYDIKNNYVNKTQNMKTYNDIYSDYRSTYYMVGYKVEDNKLTKLIKGKESYIYELTYSLSGFNLISSRKLNFSVNYPTNLNGSEGGSKLLYINDKLISIYQKQFETNRKNKNGKYYLIKGNKPIQIQVFDINKDKLVYEGEIISSNIYSSNNLYITNN